MKLNGLFKGLGGDLVSDASIIGGMALGRKAVGMIPSSIGGKDIKPVFKGAAAYFAISMIDKSMKQKGIMKDVLMGARLGAASAALATIPALAKLGVAGMNDTYVNGTEIIRIKPIAGLGQPFKEIQTSPGEPFVGNMNDSYVNAVYPNGAAGL